MLKHLDAMGIEPLFPSVTSTTSGTICSLGGPRKLCGPGNAWMNPDVISFVIGW
jgi:hypothetical protein